MPNTTPITDAYIDSIIKANETGNNNPDKTQGKSLRELVKLMRDHFEQASGQETFNTIQPDANGFLRVTGGIEQVTATRDLLLDVIDRAPGKSGTLFIIQLSLIHI